MLRASIFEFHQPNLKHFLSLNQTKMLKSILKYILHNSKIEYYWLTNKIINNKSLLKKLVRFSNRINLPNSNQFGSKIATAVCNITNLWVLIHYSPDFRARASSNASSTGRLSPIFSEQLSTADYGLDSVAEQGQADQLAGSLAQTVRLSQPLQTLESYRDVFLDNRPPPPPYSSLSIQSCPIHGYQGCSCFNLNQLENAYIKQVRRTGSIIVVVWVRMVIAVIIYYYVITNSCSII